LSHIDDVTHPRQTPLSRALDATPDRKVTPLDAFRLARTRWLAGDRLDIGKLATELGVGRATVFRWVGSREQLYGEICSQLFTKALERAEQGAKGHGVDKLIEILETLLRALAGSPALRYFVEQDPEFAMRVLTSRANIVQRRTVQQIRELLFQLVPEPALPAEELAYIIVRVTESFLYRDVITGDKADIDAAIRAIRVLLTAPPEKKRKR
jgi:AcrR family transcriptional regulator